MTRTPLSREDLLAAKNLRRLWEEKKYSLALTQEKAADMLGYSSQSAVSQYLRGRIALNTEAVMRFAKILEVSPEEIDPRIASVLPRKSISFADFPVAERIEMEVSVAKKEGDSVCWVGTGKQKIVLDMEWFERHRIDPGACRAASVSGNAMSPYLKSHDLVVIDTSDTGLDDGEVYALLQQDSIYYRRIAYGPAGLTLVADNPAFSAQVLDTSAAPPFVLGRVVYRAG